MKEFVAAPQEYQEPRSDEEDGELYEKVATPDGAVQGDKFGSGGDKRRRKSDVIIVITFTVITFIVIVISSSSLQAQRGSLVQLGGGQRPQEGSHQTDEVPDEEADVAVGQGERIHPR